MLCLDIASLLGNQFLSTTCHITHVEKQFTFGYLGILLHVANLRNDGHIGRRE